MQFAIRVLLVFAVAVFLLPQSSTASVVFKPGKKPQYVGPGGEEEMNGDAAELFQVGQTAEKEGDYKRAIRAYKSLVRRHPRDKLAAEALYGAARLQEKEHQNFAAADSFGQLVEKYPGSPHFEEAIEAQFRIGEIYVNGKKLKFLGIPIASALDRAVTIFANVVRTAPYGKYTARAQFDIGLARQKQGANDAAIQAYQAVIEKFPNDPVAADAQYQIGYIWFSASRGGTKDLAATINARTAFQDFLFRYPNSEKVAQARANLQILEHKSLNSAFSVARYYDKMKAYRAAVIYYNEVIRQQPGSAESEKAKKRIDQLRAKVGEKALAPLQDTEEEKKKAAAEEKAKSKAGTAPAPSSAPILPSDLDTSLPPPPSGPSSLMPTGSSSTEPENSPTPEPSIAPDQTPEASPAPSLPDDAGSSEAAASPTP